MLKKKHQVFFLNMFAQSSYQQAVLIFASQWNEEEKKHRSEALGRLGRWRKR